MFRLLLVLLATAGLLLLDAPSFFFALEFVLLARSSSSFPLFPLPSLSSLHLSTSFLTVVLISGPSYLLFASRRSTLLLSFRSSSRDASALLLSPSLSSSFTFSSSNLSSICISHQLHIYRALSWLLSASLVRGDHDADRGLSARFRSSSPALPSPSFPLSLLPLKASSVRESSTPVNLRSHDPLQTQD